MDLTSGIGHKGEGFTLLHQVTKGGEDSEEMLEYF
jgi:hypothetical protein